MITELLRVNLSAGYGKRTILDDVSFQMHAGERLGLLGTSGAGKSTLLLALLGLLGWRGGWVRGEVSLLGTNLLALKERQARRIRGSSIALVPQSPTSALNSALSLKTHLRHAWLAHEGACDQAFERRVSRLLQRVQLPADPQFLARRPGQVSVGQAQRFALTLALLHKPALVIADEPTSALDPCTQIEVLTLLKELNEEEGTAILFVSHDLVSVLRLCDRVTVLDHGRLVEDLPAQTIAATTQPALRQLLETLPVPAAVLLRHLAPQARTTAQESPVESLTVTSVR